MCAFCVCLFELFAIWAAGRKVRTPIECLWFLVSIRSPSWDPISLPPPGGTPLDSTAPPRQAIPPICEALHGLKCVHSKQKTEEAENEGYSIAEQFIIIAVFGSLFRNCESQIFNDAELAINLSTVEVTKKKNCIIKINS